ncbi:MAG: hydroxymethylglutaryl-CoA reductase (NADPH) [Thaumarchaeota archaeon]|nr:hydroxymethylglutaryl-CoA reductase (NADPH) [Candidatus Calditenuaceae archaeon]MDW8187445.1 hydroxymethylglutaryl-CoA reductase (NADPH) [Nitrososphaerota archaeon]
MAVEEVRAVTLEDLLNGKVKLHVLDDLVGAREATILRREYLEHQLGVDLSPLGADLPFEKIVGRNCENTIGSVTIPVGIAGPLPVEGEYFKGNTYVPLATTEGALVATVNRGSSAIRASGAVKVKLLDDKMTRAPSLETPGIEWSLRLVKWIDENFTLLRESFRSATAHGDLRAIRPFVAGKYVFLRLEATTGDAMGMNMVTRAAERVVEEIVSRLEWVRHVSLSGNLCTDKKPAAVNWIAGRGKTVSAEAVIKREVVESVLKTTPEAVMKVVAAKLYLGSALAGVLGGFNAHVANVIAAVFLATGQDLAQVVESSMSITYADVTSGGDLYFSLTVPSLEVGTVGGGTWLPAQRAALSIMGVAGPGDPPGTNAKKFAEVLTAAAMAGELSLVSALSAHHLAKAHERLGRGRRQ